MRGLRFYETKIRHGETVVIDLIECLLRKNEMKRKSGEKIGRNFD